MMNSAPAVVGASDGLAAFRSIIANRGPALLGRGGRRCGSASHGAGDLYAVIVARARTGPRRAASRDKAGSALGRGGLAAAAAPARGA